jgi:hypothetical protein
MLTQAGEEVRTAAAKLAISTLDTDTRSRVERRSARHLVVAVGSAVLVILAVLLVTLTPLGDEGTVVDDPRPTTVPTTLPATTVTSPSPTTTPPTPTTVAAVPAIPVPSITWTRIDDPAVFGETDTWINTVAVTEHGLIAGGSDGMSGIVWTSTDGSNWSRLADPDGVFGTQQSPLGEESFIAMFDFASNNGRTVAVGLDYLWKGGKESSVAPFWYTDDGIVWHRIPHDDDLFGESEVNSVVVHNGGFLAVGSSIWLSDDGLSWQRIGEAPRTALGSVISTAFGLIAAGDDGQPVPAASVWLSGDGTAWTQAEIDGSPSELTAFRCHMSDIAQTPAGFVAVGCWGAGGGPGASNRNAAVWQSADGSRWSLVEYSVSGRHDELWGVAADGDRLVATGEMTNPSRSNSGMIWTSTDAGTTWEAQDDPTFVFGNIHSDTRHAFTRDIVAFDGGFVAVGAYTTGGPEKFHATVWFGEWDE